MRHLKLILTVSLAAAVAGWAPAASAEPVLVVGKHGIGVRSEPIPRYANFMPVPGASVIAGTVASSRRRTVPRAIRREAARRKIDSRDRTKYLANYSAAVATHRRLSGQRRSELGYVLGVTRNLARTGRLNAGRMRLVFLNLQRNTEWWGKAGPPGSGKRLQFGGSRVLFQYFPGRGLQFHPLANFGQLNGYWYAKKNQNLRSLADDLVSLRVVRNGFVTWEYLFAFGGGAPPWISGMAQGTAMQALARASARLADPRLLEIAKRGRGAFERKAPVGVRVPSRSGAWYALYSFNPHMNVLNGLLQAINGLRTYSEFAHDKRADRLFASGDRVARSVIRSFDTGAWSLYSRPGGKAGAEANLNYHTLNRDFARNLCKGTKTKVYCDVKDRFTKYLKQDPTFGKFRAVPSPAKSGRGVRVKFRLSKISKVAVAIKNESGKTVYSNSASMARGPHYFRWVPPKRKGEHQYRFQLSARDLAGNGNTVGGEVTVRP